MTLHQLTHAITFDGHFSATALLRGTVDRLVGLGRHWAAQRRLDQEMSKLDHRERADLALRK